MTTAQWSNRIEFALGVFWGITLLTPLAIMPSSIGSSRPGILVAILWTYRPPGLSEHFGFTTGPLHFFNTLPLLVFSLLFAGQTTRCCINSASRKLAVVLGIASLVLPAFLAAWIAWRAIMEGASQYVGPLPHQFIFGILLIWLTRPEEDFRIWIESDKMEIQSSHVEKEE